VEPKRMLTGMGDERVDTRVLQVIYSVVPAAESGPVRPELYVGQQMDVQIDTNATPAPHEAL
jgi:HlyD family secretion protein